MSQHALKLAEALQAIADKDRYRITSGSPGPLYTSGWLSAVAYFSEVAREALVAYLASDEHAEDLERAQAATSGFQGLAGKAEPK